jgi:hypothetical protein
MKIIEVTKREAEFLYMAIEDRIESLGDGAIFGEVEGELEALKKLKGQLLGGDSI